jgi:hypothetical protein
MTQQASGSWIQNGGIPPDWKSEKKQFTKKRFRDRNGDVRGSEQSPSNESRDGLLRYETINENDNYSGSEGVSEMNENFETPFIRRKNQKLGIRSPNLRLVGKSQSPFANIGKSTAEKAPRSTFLPTTFGADEAIYPTFICPRCKTRQREFFTVENAAGHLEGPGSYLALYFAVYVTCSLFIFGLEEGWKPLDCIYFAVITLTTAGLVRT